MNKTNYGYIYKITNIVNNKIYIGKTKHTIEKRFKNHIWSAYKHSQKYSIPLQNAIRHYGSSNFIIEEIEKCSIEHLDEREIYWIAKYNSCDSSIGYNLAPGGEGGIGGPYFQGHHHSAETRQKMRLTNTGTNNPNYGNHWEQSEELKALHRDLSTGCNNGMYGKHHSIESKIKNKISHLGKKAFSNIKTDTVIMLYPEEGEQLINSDSNWIRGNIHCKHTN